MSSANAAAAAGVAAAIIAAAVIGAAAAAADDKNYENDPDPTVITGISAKHNYVPFSAR